MEGVYEQAEEHLGAKETEVSSNALSSSYGTMLQRLIEVTDRYVYCAMLCCLLITASLLRNALLTIDYRLPIA